MTWILLAVVAVGLCLFVGARTSRQRSARGLGKGEGSAGSARYKNRSSESRDKRP